MIRTAAALFARKTAVVAVTGAVVLGGATFALAEVGAPPEEGSCDVGEVVGADGLCEVDPNADAGSGDDPASCDDALTTDVVEECPADEDEDASCDDALTTDVVEECPADEDEDADCDDALTTDVVEECPADEDEDASCDDALTTDVVEECPADEDEDAEEDLAEGEDAASEHPENHGKYVSEAAKGGGPCEGLTGRDKGQCVAGVARSDAGKKGAEEPAAEEPVVEEPAPETEAQELQADEAPAATSTGRPAHAGPPAGKGRGAKG